MAKAPAGSKGRKPAGKAAGKDSSSRDSAQDAGGTEKPSPRPPSAKLPPLDLAALRDRIDTVDRAIQDLIGERARYAGQVGKAKGKLAA